MANYLTSKHYTKKGLIQAVKTAKANPDAVFVFNEFGLYDKTAKQFLKWFMDCLHTKINREIRQTGRKTSSEYQLNLRLDANRINDYTKGIRHSGCLNLLRTAEMKERFHYINSQESKY